MGEILYTIFTFLIAISVLIAIHEFGHFWVAKKLGVKVLRYSIGFGKPLWKKTAGIDQTEYVIAALPLGGYVKMLDEREGEVPEKDRHRAFNRQPVWKRFAIVFAGPAFNFIFAFVAYWMVINIGITDVKPIIGEVYADTPAERAGLKTGMEITSVGGAHTPIWEVVYQESLINLVDNKILHLEVTGDDGVKRAIKLNVVDFDLDKDTKQLFEVLGFKPFRIPLVPEVGETVSGSPARKAGLKTGDLILSIDDKDINDWRDMVEIISKKPGQLVNVVVLREGKRLEISFMPEAKKRKNQLIGVAGIKSKGIDEKYKATYKLSALQAIPYSLKRTADMSLLTLKLLGKIVVGEVSVKNISGPLSIADAVGKSANLGWVYFLSIMAIVSISLGVLNLLPVPVLDGGHLMFYIVEMVKGSPVSETVEALAQRAGIALLLMLMMLALYNDIVRIVG